MKPKQIKIMGAAVLALALVGIAVPTARTETAASLTAIVVDQVCAGGVGSNVTLTATLSPARSGVTYRWDFTNNGTFETEESEDPTVLHNYPDDEIKTARVRATKGRHSAEDTVTFHTLFCP